MLSAHDLSEGGLAVALADGFQVVVEHIRRRRGELAPEPLRAELDRRERVLDLVGETARHLGPFQRGGRFVGLPVEAGAEEEGFAEVTFHGVRVPADAGEKHHTIIEELHAVRLRSALVIAGGFARKTSLEYARAQQVAREGVSFERLGIRQLAVIATNTTTGVRRCGISSYIPSSRRFGSIMINRTSSGVAR
mgnify:CR=1 FL=1